VSGAIDWEALVDAAERARGNAHAPYSSFPVGAAILAQGRVFAGCNVENASFPVGICAERAALAAAIAAGCPRIEAVVVAAERPVAPCGMCRQALAEFDPEVPIMMCGGSKREVASLRDLLPSPFSPTD